MHAGPQNLDHDVLAGLQRRRVNLGNGGGGEWGHVETTEELIELGTQSAFDGCDRDIAAERRHSILELGQFVGNVHRNQIAARG